MSINYNKLVPVCYAIANANGVDLGVGDSMMQNNIRLGRDEHKGATVLPRAFRPDWAKLHEENPDLAAVNGEFNAYIRKRMALMVQLKPLWKGHRRSRPHLSARPGGVGEGAERRRRQRG